jgi:hypothetical protein
MAMIKYQSIGVDGAANMFVRRRRDVGDWALSRLPDTVYRLASLLRPSSAPSE